VSSSPKVHEIVQTLTRLQLHYPPRPQPPADLTHQTPPKRDRMCDRTNHPQLDRPTEPLRLIHIHLPRRAQPIPRRRQCLVRKLGIDGVPERLWKAGAKESEGEVMATREEVCRRAC